MDRMSGSRFPVSFLTIRDLSPTTTRGDYLEQKKLGEVPFNFRFPPCALCFLLLIMRFYFHLDNQ